MTAETLMPPPAAAPVDPELQAALARDALAGFDHLLGFVPAAAPLPAGQVGALVRLIRQAETAGRV